MSLSSLVTHNRWQKLFSFLFAVLIWFNIRQGLDRAAGPDTRTFPHVPIMVLTLASDPNQFRVRPTEVSVTVRGTPETLARLHPQDIEAYVNLSEAVPTNGHTIPVHVQAPNVQAISVFPMNVFVEQIAIAPPRPR